MWAAAQAVNGRIYLIGNGRPDSDRRGPQTLEFDPASNSFTFKAPFAAPRGAFGSAVANGWIYLLGGTRGAGKWMPTAERYSPSADKWEKVPDLPKPTGYPGVAELDGRIYLLGGVTDKFDNAERTFYQVR